jgi:hypothetical protein
LLKHVVFCRFSDENVQISLILTKKSFKNLLKGTAEPNLNKSWRKCLMVVAFQTCI